jgi:hypothetical protein
MIYYRIATRSTRTNMWLWKSTELTSLDALFRLLRLYNRAPEHLTRVFFASSKLYLYEMLERENDGIASNSLTLERFLKEKRIDTQEMLRLEAEVATPLETRQTVSAFSNPSRSLHASNAPVIQQAGIMESIASASSPANRQLQHEQQPGGDHDTPYTFSLPLYMPQALAWTVLLARVQRGELVP